MFLHVSSSKFFPQYIKLVWCIYSSVLILGCMLYLIGLARNLKMDSCAVSVDEIEESQVISRTEAPDNSLKFWKIDNCLVKDENSVEYRFGEIYKDQKTIIIFIRVSNCLYLINCSLFVAFLFKIVFSSYFSTFCVTCAKNTLTVRSFRSSRASFVVCTAWLNLTASLFPFRYSLDSAKKSIGKT